MKKLEIIMILTNAFEPDMRVYKEAKYLVDQGHSVEILCWDRENKRVNQETIDGIKVKRFYPQAKYGSGLKQLKPFNQFIKECKVYIKGRQIDFIHCHDLDGVVCGKRIKPKQTKLIFDMHEMYDARSKNQMKNKVIKSLMKYYLKVSDAIIYVNPIQIEHYSDKLKEKCYFLPNYPSKETFETVNWTPSDKIRITYIGAVRQFEQFDILLSQAKNFDDVEFNIHGKGVAYERLKEKFSNQSNINLTGRFDGREIAELYSKADIQYIIYPKMAYQYLIAIPVKFYESVLTRTPVIVGKGTSLEEIVTKYDIGFVVDGDDETEVKKLMIQLSENPNLIHSKRNNFNSLSGYSWEESVQVLDEIYLSN